MAAVREAEAFGPFVGVGALVDVLQEDIRPAVEANGPSRECGASGLITGSVGITTGRGLKGLHARSSNRLPLVLALAFSSLALVRALAFPVLAALGVG